MAEVPRALVHAGARVAVAGARATTVDQLGSIFPNLDDGGLWALEGMTLLPGIDDYPKKTEVTSLGRNQAIAMTEAWASANGIPLQVQYTLPVEQYGLDPNGESVLKSAVANKATVSSVNVMVFDYYIAGEGVVKAGGDDRAHGWTIARRLRAGVRSQT